MLCLLLLCLGAAFAATGVDVSQPVSVSTFQCFQSEGYGSFVIARGYESGGVPDPNVCTTISNARAAGIPYHDVYIFPCVSCGNGAGQIDALVQNLKNCGYDYSGGSFGMVWLDIEIYNWSTDQSANQQFFSELVSGCKANNLVCGVYTNANGWGTIMGGSCDGANAGLPLWWAYWNNEQNFNGFASFGCWSAPNMKQYNGDVTVCGFDVDPDWY